MELGRVRILELDGSKNPSGNSYNLAGIDLSVYNTTPLPITTRLCRTSQSPSIDLASVVGFGTNLSIDDNALYCDIKLIDTLWPHTSIELDFHAIMLADNNDPRSVTRLFGIMMSPLTK